jgi:hypothetical protein
VPWPRSGELSSPSCSEQPFIWRDDSLHFGENICYMKNGNTVACSLGNWRSLFCHKISPLHHYFNMKTIEKGDYVKVIKGIHNKKSGEVIKVHRVFISIRFKDGNEGGTIPDFLKIIKKPTEPVKPSNLSSIQQLDQKFCLLNTAMNHVWEIL